MYIDEKRNLKRHPKYKFVKVEVDDEACMCSNFVWNVSCLLLYPVGYQSCET